MIPNLIVPTLNQYDRLQQMVNSINYPVNHLLIIDNGGKLRELFVPDYVVNVTILNMPSNLGVAASWNLGIKLFSKDPYFVFGSDDIILRHEALEKVEQHCGPDNIWTVDEFPHWQLFSVGVNVAIKVGLFDEAIYPANFEDDDYERRCKHYGVEIGRVQIQHTHYAHSTVFADEKSRANNSVTYKSNQEYFQHKIATNDYSSGGWDIIRRNTNSWD